MVLSVPVIALGATLGTATSLLALCGLTCFCKYKRPGKGSSDKERDLETENAKPSVLQALHQFNVEKTAEPVQPRTILGFPHIYGPKPVVTTSEIVNYVDYNLKTVEEPSKGKPEALDKKRMTIQVNEELFLLPQNGGVKDVCVTEHLSPENAAGCNQVPELHYCLGYNRQKEALSVALLEVLYGTTSGDQNNGSDCYILGTLVSNSGTIEAQTVMKKKEIHVVWEEGLLFPVKEKMLQEVTLTLTLRNCDKFSRHSIIGEIKPNLASVGEQYGPVQSEKVKVLNKEPDMGYGEVLLSISYLPAANRLLVVLIKAKSLHSKQLKELIGKDISVKVTLKHQALKLKKKQTKHAKHKINPVWNEMIMFEVPHDLLCASSVELEMLSQDADGQNRLLGKCSLGLHAVGTERNHWEEMLRNPRRQIAMWHQLHM
ncbi:synaptotagmin-13 [Ahaetulla prasina]|uniref:synaptotagmin-13 n=1 Tax=Ahaetulla prasina TaxID=499056 RepID=UPI002647C491|nr:synaptotagmin-13 [Ahaetulla prasina]